MLHSDVPHGLLSDDQVPRGIQKYDDFEYLRIIAFNGVVGANVLVGAHPARPRPIRLGALDARFRSTRFASSKHRRWFEFANPL